MPQKFSFLSLSCQHGCCHVKTRMRLSSTSFSFQHGSFHEKSLNILKSFVFKYFELYYVFLQYFWLCKSILCMLSDFNKTIMEDITSKLAPTGTALRFDINTQNALRQDLLVHVISLTLTLLSSSPFWHLEPLKLAQTVIFGFGRFLSWLKIHSLNNYLTYINQISLTSVKVTAARYIFNTASSQSSVHFV